MGHPVARAEFADARAADDVLIGLHEPDDAAVVEYRQQGTYTRSITSAPWSTILYFRKDCGKSQPWGYFAMGGDPQTALAVATVPFGIESKVRIR